MGRKCVVPYCRTGYSKNNEKLSLFAIPKDRVKEFNQAIARGDRVLTQKDYVCEKHFKPECIIREHKTKCFTFPLKIPKLQSGSLPTIFPNYPVSKYFRKKSNNKILKQADTKMQTLQNSDAEICHQIIKQEDEMETQNSDADMVYHCSVDREICHQIIKQEDAEIKTLNSDAGRVSTKLLPDFIHHCSVAGDICHQIMKREDADMETLNPDAGTVDYCSVEEVKVEQTASDEIGICEPPFEVLWRNHEVLLLPSNLWNIHLIPNGDNNLIAIMKLTPFENNILVEKKVVVNKHFEVSCYIFEHLSNLAQNVEIADIGQLNNFLIKFDNLVACCGSFAEVPDNYKSTVYYKDPYCQSWRHRKCDFIAEENVNDSKYYTVNKKCNYCTKIRSALSVFRLRERNAISKEVRERRKRQQMQKRESRLKTKLERMSELEHYREKLKTS